VGRHAAVDPGFLSGHSGDRLDTADVAARDFVCDRVHYAPTDTRARAAVVLTPDYYLGDCAQVSAGRRAGTAAVVPATQEETSGRREGGVMTVGGERLHDDSLLVAPTVFEGVAVDALLSCEEEVFGPVTTIYEFSELDDAIERAHGVPFGRSSSIYTSNLATELRFQRESQAGLIHELTDGWGRSSTPIS
jgi:hypothetical protein